MTDNILICSKNVLPSCNLIVEDLYRKLGSGLNGTYLSPTTVIARTARPEAVAGRSNLQMLDLKQKDCFASLIAMDGMYAENAAVRRSGAFFCRKDA